MRWDALFDDLEAQFSAQRAQQLEAEIADAVELERARTPMLARLRAGIGSEVQVRLAGDLAFTLEVTGLGSDWVSGRAGVQSLLIPLRAVTSIDGLPLRAQPERRRARSSVGIGAALRALARSREAVIVQGLEGEIGRGVIAHVGSDHLDVVSRPGALSPAQNQQRLRTIAWEAVVLVRSD